ncbi:D-Ala-D-Ala carboxypeptidase family metallohydrolase [Pseudoclavibacter terrae]|uniref:Tape measure protein n=1 Tax=Pseudoclavibacter terrae TaxID=1530195 RepID=A0A7J5B6P5_9MICO|nr:D-Ala-D-Ala carboxypeptidase family metallohydrolase [Pseudoclavibacter terrae]KAB1639869.1 hypothetical protein F8O03_06050 [Pseudoclavibacter terrae]
MTSTGFDFGTAWIQVAPSMKGVNKAIESNLASANVSGVSRGWGESIKSDIGGAFKAAAAIAVTAFSAVRAGDFLKSSIQDAGQLEQSVGAVDVVFKESAGQISEWAAGSARSLGLTKNEYNELGTLIGTQLKNGGTAMDELAPKTNNLITLGADLSAMFGGTTKDAVGALSSALKGERDPIEAYGVSLNQAGVDAKAAELGFEKVGGALSTEANQAATLAIIMDQTADAHGQFGKELDTFAGKQAVFNALWGDAKTRIGTALLPAATAFMSLLTDSMVPALEWTAVGLTHVMTAASGIWSVLSQGDFKGGIFGLEEDSAFVDWLFEVRGGVIAFGAAWTAFDGDVTSSGFPGFMERLAFLSRTVWEEMRGGVIAFGAAWAANDGEITSSGFPGFMEASAYSVRQLVEWIGALDFSSWDGFVSSLGTGQPALASIGSSFQTLAPAVGSFVTSLPDMAGAVGTLASAALPALAGALGFLADNVDTIIQWMPLIVAGFVAWRVATVVAKNAQVAIAPIMAINNGLILANSIVQRQAARETAAAAVATGVNTGAQNAGMFATIRSTAALVGQKVAMLATSAATKAAAAAQWVMNAAMSANPIMLVVLAVAALVAGLVWFFTQTELGAAIWANFTTAIGTAWTWLWESVLSPVFTAIGAIFSWLYDNVITPIVAGIVAYVQIWAGIFTWLWDNILSPVFAAVGAIFSWIYNNVIVPIVTGIVLMVQVWAAIFTWIWTAVISVVFAAIGAIFNWLYTNVITPIVNGVVAYIQLWGTIFNWLYTNVVSPVFTAVGAVFTWLYENVIQPVWSGIQTAIQVVGDWITNTLWPGIQTVLGFMGDAFNSLKDTVTTVWDNIKKAAVAPINFVIQTVYNDGIKALFDDIAEAVGLDIRMPTASTIALASGGVLPGYTPGRDVHNFFSPTGGRLALSGGEGIIRPDTLRALGGKPWLDRVNAARGNAGQAFADGGIWEDITGGIAGAASWIGDAVGNVSKIMTDPAGAIDTLIRTPVKALLESIGGGSFGSMIAEIPLKAIDGIAEWAQTAISPPAPTSGEWAGGITLDRLRPLLAKFPGLMITDTYRDPAYNASVGGSPTSFHMDKANPAVDVAGPWGQMNAFASEVAAVGGWRQLLWQVAGHYDHVHVANQGGIYGELPTFDSGGWMQPGLAYNGSSTPEAVFTNSQWSVLEGNLGANGMPTELVIVDQDGVLIGRMQVEAQGVVESNEAGRRRTVMAGGAARGS